MRIREIRYDFVLVLGAVAVAIWLVRIGRPQAASVRDGYLHTHLNSPYPAHYQPTVEQLDRLLDGSRPPHDHGAQPEPS
jgi:hypothetical protein